MRIIPNKGVCDPHVHIFNGKAYMFTTHDRGPHEPIFTMDDWRIFSSDDLLNWKLEYTLRPEDTFLGKNAECYATDAAERNGKYYFYYCRAQSCTGVAVSENGPGGPYHDPLGKPLLPVGLADTPSYDPTVFIDDDEAKTPYIMWGYAIYGKSYYIARLNEDMISLAEPPRRVELDRPCMSDASWLTKHGGRYYLNSHCSDYAVADSVYGPYTYRGKFCEEHSTDHGTFFTYHNHFYNATATPENLGTGEEIDPYYRTTKIVYAHYKDNGDIVTEPFIREVGVGQYDASWDAIRGEWFFAASDSIVKKENAGGFEIRGIKDGVYLYFQNVNGMRQNALLRVRLANGNASPCTVEVRENSPFGAVLGVVKAENTGGFDVFRTFDCRLENTHGTHSLCFVFRGEAEEPARFEDFSFEHVRP